MRAFTAIAVAVVCFAVAFAAASDVIDAKDADFDSIISGDLVLMEFYAPWCGHCKKLAPEWEKAATALKGVATLAKLDATAEQNSARKFDIKGYPTIKIFRNGKMVGDYEGARSADGITKWVKGNAGPAVAAVATAAEFEALKTANPVLVAFFGPSSSDKYAAFEQVAKTFRASYSFAAVADAAHGSEHPESIVLFKHFDDKRSAFEGEFSVEAITSFINANGIRLFDEIGPDNYKSYLERKLPLGWLFVNNDEAGAAAKKAMDSVAADFKGKVCLVWIDATKYGGMAQRLGLEGEKYPAFAIDFEGAHFAFPTGSTIEAAAAKTFIEDYLAGKLQQTVRSEKVPEPATTNGVTTVVGSTFDEVVLSGNKYVFIEFYAPWCGHCKKLAPIYDELGAKFEKNDDIVIAKIDATANDFNQKLFAVQGFPTIFFVPKGSKEPVQYEGGRTLEDFTSFIKEKAGVDS